MQEKKNDKSKIVARVLVICAAALIVLAAAAGVILSRRYIRLGQQFIPVNAAMLDLRGAGLTDLAPLDRCTALTELDVRENKLSAEALDEFRAKHPGCRVLYSVYLNDEPHESGTESLTLEDLPNDWENLRLFENLRSLTVNHCTQPDAMETLRAELPNCEMRYSLCVGGQWFDSDAVELTAAGTAPTAMELLSQLAHFPAVRTVNLPDAVFTIDEQHSLVSAYPNISFFWSVQIGSQSVSNITTELSLAGEDAATLAQLTSALDLLPRLRSVDLTGCTAPVADRLAFNGTARRSFRRLDGFGRGQTFEWNTEFIDLNNYSIADVSRSRPRLPSSRKLHAGRCATRISPTNSLTRSIRNLRTSASSGRSLFRKLLSTHRCAVLHRRRVGRQQGLSHERRHRLLEILPISRGSTSAT